MSEILWQRGDVQLTKREIVALQLKEAKQREPGKYPYVSCYGHIPAKAVPLWAAVRCYYCGQFYCEACAAEHFGKSREEYNYGRNGTNKMKYLRIHLIGGGVYIQPLNHLSILIDEIQNAAENAESAHWDLKLIDMTEEEYQALPEFTGH